MKVVPSNGDQWHLYKIFSLWTVQGLSKSINTKSKEQAVNLKDQVAETGAEKEAFNKSNGKPNEGTEGENDQNEHFVATITS